jgi:hypothetical protein
LTPNHKRLFGLAALSAAVALHALTVMAIAVDASKLNFNPPASLERMLSGTAENPFGQRVLLAWILRGVRGLTPRPLESAIESWCRTSPFCTYLTAHVFVTSDLGYEALLELGLMYACLLGFAWFLFRVARELFPDSRRYAIVAPFMGLACVPPWWQQLYMYDYATLLVWTACLYSLHERQWNRYLLWFTLGMLNRETTVLLLLPYLVYGRHVLPTKTLRAHAATQGAVALLIKVSLMVAHAGNGGEVALWNLGGQVKQLLVAPYGLAQWVTFLCVILLLTYRWDQKPLVVKCQLLTFAPLFAAYLLAGRPGEYRVFMEIVPAASLLATHTLVSWSGLASRSTGAASADGSSGS